MPVEYQDSTTFQDRVLRRPGTSVPSGDVTFTAVTPLSFASELREGEMYGGDKEMCEPCLQLCSVAGRKVLQPSL